MSFLIRKLNNLILIMLVLNSFPSLAMQLILPTKVLEPEDLSRKERFIHWLHNRHSPKDLGFDDPNLPTFVKFNPVMIPLPEGYQLPRAFIVRNELLDMRSLTPKALKRLKPQELTSLLTYLSSVPVQIKWSNQSGHTQSGKKFKERINYSKRWEQSNAALALSLTMGITQPKLFARMIGAAPEIILPELRTHMLGLISARINAQIIAALLAQLELGTSNRIARAISLLTQQGLSYWVNKDITKLNPYLAEMLEETFAILDASNPISREAVAGLLMGSVLAGTLNHVALIKRTDEKRIWIVGVVSNLIWAATSFIACVPIATPIVAATAGGISVGAVLSTVVYTALNFPRDFSPSVRQIEGNLETAALESTLIGSSDVKINVVLMLSWMRAAIHVNGLGD